MIEEGTNAMIQNTPDGILLENRYARILLKPDGKVGSFFDKGGRREAIDASAAAAFCTLIDQKKQEIAPDALTLEGEDILLFSFSGCTVRIRTEVYDRFFTFELLDVIDSAYYAFRFADFRLDYDYKAGTFVAAGYAMTVQTHHVFFPSGEEKAVRAECFTALQTAGAKLAVIAAPKAEQRDILKEINTYVKPGELPLTQGGGANALDWEENYGDYVIIYDSDPAKVPGWIDLYSAYSVDQLDFHKGGTTFIQGSFEFPVTGSAANFKKYVADPLYQAGILCSLHTYSFYIDYAAKPILSNPKWQQQLEILERFTLKKAVSETDTNLMTVEDTSGVSEYFGFMAHNSPYLLIDREIVRYTVGKGGFVSCVRGECGTKAEPHSAGAEIRHIGGYYSGIAPIIGSELFYEIARLSAKAYNEGGFRMFYLDAFDSIQLHCRYAGMEDYIWYYAATFVNEIVRHCDISPMFEYSMIIPSIWTARGRGGAWDTPSRSYKVWNRLHLESNQKLLDRYYTTTMGWYNFYPFDPHYPGNFSVKYKHLDDVDYLGVLGIAYDQSIVYNGLTRKGLDGLPALKRNMDRYLEYSRLRKSHYFSDAVKEILRAGKHEYTLTCQDGVYGFTEVEYPHRKLIDLAHPDYNTLEGENPFGAQNPFIRIENLMSSVGEDPIPVMKFDEEKPLKEQTLITKFAPLNIKEHLALKVRVLGNGSDDAICIRLKGLTMGESGVSDYLIRLNYDGWRDFVLTEVDNGEFTEISFDKRDNNYAVYRATVNYDQITNVEVYLHGNCDGVRMSDILACTHTMNALKNPSVLINGQKITFCGRLENTEYLEYTPGSTAAQIIDARGETREVTVSGSITVPEGRFTATLSGDSAGNGPARAELTFGLYGSFISNPS